MSKLVNIPQVNQKQLLNLYTYAIRNGGNVLVIGPSGAGKTDMAFQACEATDKNLIYWNMSVMERPDIQGLPVISHDKKTANFAPIEGMPFIGLDNIKNYRTLVSLLDKSKDLLKTKSNEANITMRQSEEIDKLKKNILLFESKLAGVNEDIYKTELSKFEGNYTNGNYTSKNVLVLDEVDKTPPENLNPLLELLLYKSINGNPLDICAVILTGNLPDEQAFSEPLSHAITSRTMVCELVPDYKVWLDWAALNNKHPVVVGFLSKDENAMTFFNKRPSNNEMYSYAYSNPRAWDRLSSALYTYEKELDNGIDFGIKEHITRSIVGEEAATNLEVWFKYYKEYDPLINEIFSGKDLPPPDEPDAIIVCALALASKVSADCKEEDTSKSEEIRDRAGHVFQWIEKHCDKDIKLCAMRSSYDKESFVRHGLHKYHVTKTMFEQIIKMYSAIKDASNKL